MGLARAGAKSRIGAQHGTEPRRCPPLIGGIQEAKGGRRRGVQGSARTAVY
jgi:hypothetical protein